MGRIEAMAVEHRLPDGRVLFADVSFRVGHGAKVALVGPNGGGKTTLLRMVAGELTPAAGGIARSGGLGVMHQFIGSINDRSVVADLALSLAPPAVRAAGERLRAAERALDDGERSQLRYADALAGWGEAGGHGARGQRPAGRPRPAGALLPDPRPPRARRPHAAGGPRRRRRRPAGLDPWRCDEGTRPLRAGRAGRPAVRHALGRPAGAGVEPQDRALVRRAG